MVIDSEDDMSQLEPPRRAYSMLFAEEDPYPRTSAFSMLCSEDELSERAEHFQSRPRAFSMLWSDELDAIPEQSEASQTECQSKVTSLIPTWPGPVTRAVRMSIEMSARVVPRNAAPPRPTRKAPQTRMEKTTAYGHQHNGLFQSLLV